MPSPEERGKRLGFLIASLDFSVQQREALLGLLPQMTEAQLEKLTDILEAGYLQAATRQSDSEFADALQDIDKKYLQTINQANTETTKELDAIS